MTRWILHLFGVTSRRLFALTLRIKTSALGKSRIRMLRPVRPPPEGV
jgi:hypothetical protein